MDERIELFVPFPIENKEIDYSYLESVFRHRPRYASKGRYAIIHILHSYGIKDGLIGVSAYTCPTVSSALIENGFTPIYYDIDLVDLNPDIGDISKILENNEVRAVVVNSIYGNPANLSEIENLCNTKNTIMIDDAAQSFGAMLDDRYVGSFGNGGFFSFSPGKPTAAHLGAFYWTNSSNYDHPKTKHPLYNWISWNYFYVNRLNAYKSNKLIKKLLQFCYILTSRTDIKNDVIDKRATSIYGGVIHSNSSNALKYRRMWYEQFIDITNNYDSFRMLKPIRGTSNPSKIVFLFNNADNASQFALYLKEKSVAFYAGYKVSMGDRKLRNAEIITGKIVELPIDPNNGKMEHLKALTLEYFDKRAKEAQ